MKTRMKCLDEYFCEQSKFEIIKTGNEIQNDPLLHK